MMNINVVAYARYSTDHQNESTIETQFEAIHKFCDEHGYIIMMRFVDRGLSGTEVEHREGFQMMIDYITNNPTFAIVTYTRDRFSRNLKDFVHYLNIIDSLGCQLLCVNGGNDSTASGQLSAWVNMSIAEYYVKNLSREVIRGLRYNANNGMVIGKPLLGYDKGKDGKYVINESEAEIVKIIFQMTADGCSRQSIVVYLHDNGYRTKDGKLIEHPLKRILINRKYIGEYSYHITANGLDENIIIPNGMPRIISDELFNKVQGMLLESETHLSNIPKSLLHGKVVDGYCGYTFKLDCTAYDSDGNPKDFLYRPDKKRLNIKRAKDISSSLLDDFTISILEETLLSRSSTGVIYKLLKKIFDKRKEELDTQIKNLNESKNEVLIEYNKILKMLVLSSEEETTRLLAELSTLKNQIMKLDNEAIELNEKYMTFPTVTYGMVFGQIMVNYGRMIRGTPLSRKNTLRMFINRIVLFDDFLRYEINLLPYINKRDNKLIGTAIAMFDIKRSDIKMFINQSFKYKLGINELKLEVKE